MTKAPAPEPVARKEIGDRSAVEPALQWKLEHIFPKRQDWENEFNRVESAIRDVGAFQGTLGKNVAALKGALELHSQVAATLDRVYVYAHLLRDEDTRDPEGQALAERAARLGTRFAEAVSFLEPEILAIPSSDLTKMLESKELKLWRHYLEDLLRKKQHTLSPREEEMLAMAGEVARIPRTVFGMLNDADLTFGTIRDERGQEVEITHGRYSLFLESNDRRVRRDTWLALYQSYAAHKNTFASLLSGAVKRDIFFARARGYSSSLHAALHPANIPVEVYHTLVATVDEKREVVHRAMSMRRRLLGVDDLRVHDLHAPLALADPPQVSWSEACRLLFEGLAPLGEEYLEALRRGLAGGWIDVMETRGKRSGAYSWGAYGTHPYVLLNYQGTIDHLFTLAHEMGHAMHHFFTNETQPYVYSHYPIFLAEVASTTNEALLLDHLLRVQTDPVWKTALLTQAIDQIRGTVITQVIFAQFELALHEMAEAGEPLTVASFSEAYRRVFTRMLGPDLVFDDMASLGWARIPHFYNNFYVYQYATGYAAAIALSRRVLNDGDAARKDYLGFLKAGDSDYPIEILRRAGVDLSSPKPVLDTLERFASLLDQLEEHLSQHGAAAVSGG
jgi:oligoendopeptidase F